MAKPVIRGFANISKRVGEAPAVLQLRLKAALQESLEEGRDEMRRLIEARGSRSPWVANWDGWKNAHPGRRGSEPGRVASGKMRDMATFTMSSDTKYRVRGRVGWVGRLGKNRYFTAQDQGFTHHITGQQIEGMMVLRDAARKVDEEFEKRAEKIARDVANFDF